jgi:hypothetical protein
MVNLFYPDQSNGGAGSLNDDKQAPWMESNPSYWLYSTSAAKPISVGMTIPAWEREKVKE